MSEYYSDSNNAGGLPPTIPPPDWIENISCYSPELLHNLRYLEEDHISFLDVTKSTVILITAILAITFNMAFLAVLNSSYYTKYLRPTPRYILSAMAINDWATGIVVLSLGVYPAIFECWPFGKFACQLQVKYKYNFISSYIKHFEINF